MSPLLIAGICTVIVGTSFLSGIFGMAGAMVLVGVLLAVLPVPEAMALPAVTQVASHGWRAVLRWRHVRWRAVAARSEQRRVGQESWITVESRGARRT